MTDSPCLAGTHLKALLARFGIHEIASGCKCQSHAAIMDKQGCDWVESHVDLIVSWMRHESKRRGLPFLDIAARILVKESIRRARREAKAAMDRPNG
jgi:hypothetical protein